MAIEINVHNAVSMSIVNQASGSGHKWIEIVVKELDGSKHEINIISACRDSNIAMFLGCKEND